MQALCLLIVTLGTLIYTICKAKIKTYQVDDAISCILIGIFLGIMSSFLGIGGGPINLVVLFFFFSMSTKIAAENSLYIIFFSQIASLMFCWRLQHTTFTHKRQWLFLQHASFTHKMQCISEKMKTKRIVNRLQMCYDVP